MASEIAVIGFGELGRNLIKLLQQTSSNNFEYILIDSVGDEEYLFKIPKANSFFEYEELTKNLKFPRFSNTIKEVFLFTAGGTVSGTISSLMSYYKLVNEETKDLLFKVWFVKPNFQNLSEKKASGSRNIFNALSGLTKAGVLSDMFIFDNEEVERIPKLSVKDYFLVANQNISYFFQMNILLDKGLLSPVYSTYDNSLEFENMFHAFSMVDFQKGNMKPFGTLKGEHIQRLVVEIPSSALENEQENFSAAAFRNLLTRLKKSDTVASYFDVVEAVLGEKNGTKTNYNTLDKEKIVSFVKSSTVVLQQI